MVQEELITETKGWRSSLATYREDFVKAQKQLLELASKRLTPEDLKELEHFQNQFYIQLINIHDVKKDLHYYEYLLGSNATEQMIDKRHDQFKDEYESLTGVLDGLKNEFKAYLDKPHGN